VVERLCDDKTACTTLAFRAAAGQPFAPLETEAGATLDLFAIDPGRRRLLAVGRGGDRKTARFYSWSLDGHPGRTTELFDTDRWVRGAMAVDDRGAVVLVTEHMGAWKVFRSSDEGATFESTMLAPEIKVAEIALAGDRGLLRDEAGGYSETASSGKTWAAVTGIGSRSSIECTREGCAVGAERRLGWDSTAGGRPAPIAAASRETKPPDKVAGATPLRCTAGEPRELRRALVEDLDDLATSGLSGGGSLTVLVATKGEGVDIVVGSASENRIATRATPLFGAAPSRTTVGSQTAVLTTAAGVVATRATYPVDATRPKVWISPVSAELAWWRPQTGKVIHARLPPLGEGHMRGRFWLGHQGERGGLLWLTPEEVFYRPRFSDGSDTDLFTFTDGGRSQRIVTPMLQSATAAVRTSSGLALVQLGEVGGFGFARDKDEAVEPQAVWTLAPPSTSPTVLPIQRGEEAAFVVAWPGAADSPPRGFVVPARRGNDPPAIDDLGLAALLEHPRACGDVRPGAVRLLVELPRSLRRPVLVNGVEKPILVRAEAVVVVVPPQGQPCVSEWVARGAGHSEIAVIPLATPSRAWWLSAADVSGVGGVRSRDLTVRALRCEEAPGLTIPASFERRGF
jgi:hypothetical protein